METAIKNLVELAREYKAFGEKYKLASGFTTLNDHCRIYFANNRDTCSVYFDRIDVSLYKDTIEIPFDVTSKKLSDILTKHQVNLSELEKKYSTIPKNEQKQAKLQRIQELEAELNDLKELS